MTGVEFRHVCACKWMYFVNFELREPGDQPISEVVEGGGVAAEYLMVPVFLSGKAAHETTDVGLAPAQSKEASAPPGVSARRLVVEGHLDDQSWTVIVSIAGARRRVVARRLEPVMEGGPTIEYRYQTRLRLDRSETEPGCIVMREISA